jgi:hypothetical protein
MEAASANGQILASTTTAPSDAPAPAMLSQAMPALQSQPVPHIQLKQSEPRSPETPQGKAVRLRGEAKDALKSGNREKAAQLLKEAKLIEAQIGETVQAPVVTLTPSSVNNVEVFERIHTLFIFGCSVFDFLEHICFFFMLTKVKNDIYETIYTTSLMQNNKV